MKILIVAFTATLFVAASMTSVSNADLLYQNDFNGATLADNDVGAGLAFENAPFGLLAADADFASQYLSIGSNQTTGNFSFGFWDAAGAGVTGGTFMAFEWSGLYRDADSTVYRTRLRASDPGNANFTGNVDVTAGNSVADTVETYLFVVNNDAADVTLDASLNSQGYTSTIAAGDYALFQNGVATPILSGTTSGTATRLTLWHQGDNPNDVPSNFYMDDFAVYSNVAAVPEPTSLALLGLGVFGLVVRRRR